MGSSPLGEDKWAGPLTVACHAAFFSSLMFAGSRGRFDYWAFNSRAFGRDRM